MQWRLTKVTSASNEALLYQCSQGESCVCSFGFEFLFTAVQLFHESRAFQLLKKNDCHKNL